MHRLIHLPILHANELVSHIRFDPRGWLLQFAQDGRRQWRNYCEIPLDETKTGIRSRGIITAERPHASDDDLGLKRGHSWPQRIQNGDVPIDADRN